jgi:hypothetical protein
MGVVTGGVQETVSEIFEWILFAAIFASTHTTTVYNFSSDVFVKEGNSLYCSYAFLCARLGDQVTVNPLLKLYI